MRKLNGKPRPVYENLDTAYVNLAALLRYLRQHAFTGHVHVELDEYDAAVFLEDGEQTRVRETDHAAGRNSEGEAALQRLLVRASEPGGLVSVYEGTEVEQEEEEEAAANVNESPGVGSTQAEERGGHQQEEEEEGDDWDALIRLSGELIATVERAALSAGADFTPLFRMVRLSMGDDYSFLDPSAGRFEYGNGTVYLSARPNMAAYVSGISEAMRRVVDRVATGPRRSSARERAALELAILARRRHSLLNRFKFTPMLDRIAGTRVL